MSAAKVRTLKVVSVKTAPNMRFVHIVMDANGKNTLTAAQCELAFIDGLVITAHAATTAVAETVCCVTDLTSPVTSVALEAVSHTISTDVVAATNASEACLIVWGTAY